ncbi:hypothetical protein ACHAWF_016435 [Thalassiosira exigua]
MTTDRRAGEGASQKSTGQAKRENDSDSTLNSLLLERPGDRRRRPPSATHRPPPAPHRPPLRSTARSHRFEGAGANIVMSSDDGGDGGFPGTGGGGGPGPGGGFRSDAPKTFAGPRGGAAEDADLLAELRAISNKSSADRFKDDDDGGGGGGFGGADGGGFGGGGGPAPAAAGAEDPKPASNPATTKESLPSLKKKKKNASSRPLPPWKRKGAGRAEAAAGAGNDDADAVVAAAPAPPPPVRDPFANAFASVADEAQGEAQVNEGDNDNGDNGDDGDGDGAPSAPEGSSERALRGPASAEDVALASSEEREASRTPREAEEASGKRGGEEAGTESGLPETFAGSRGGAAEDADLLAELRAISNKSSADRFQTDGGGGGGAVASDEGEARGGEGGEEEEAADGRADGGPAKKKKAPARDRPPPPWKRKGAKKKAASGGGFGAEVIVAARPAPSSAAGADVIVDADAETEAEANADATRETTNDSVSNGVPQEETMGIKKSSLPNTFKGDRGGAAEDADLLAELRAISMKSAGNRFDGGDDDGAMAARKGISPTEKKVEDVDVSAPKEQLEASSGPEPSSRPLPPWKRKGAKKKASSGGGFDLDVTVAAPPAPSLVADADAAADTVGDAPKEENMGIESNLSNTFKGDRGGAAEDADLLAELRAVSMKSAGDRFNGDTNGEGAAASSCVAGSGSSPSNTIGDGDQAPSSANAAESANRNEKPTLALPPWKRKGAKKKANGGDNFGMDVVVAAPPAPPPVATDDAGVAGETAGISVSTEAPRQEDMGIKSSLPNTFKGDRGGTAEDADLLAELRAISMKSAGNRFHGGKEAEISSSAKADIDEKKPLGRPQQQNDNDEQTTTSKFLPPWKRKGSRSKKPATSETVDVLIAAPPASVDSSDGEYDEEDFLPNTFPPDSAAPPAPTLREENLGIKSSLPNTVKGGRGGAAEDADLLAELRAISMKTSSNRFDGDESGDVIENDENANKSNGPSVQNKPWKKGKTKSKVGAPSRLLPPWKKKNGNKAGANVNGAEAEIVISAAPAPSPADAQSMNLAPAAPQHETMGIKSDLPSTFKGDRGGAAEDADLLKELRAISMKSARDRFSGDECEGDNTQVSGAATGSLHASNEKSNNESFQAPLTSRKPRESQPGENRNISSSGQPVRDSHSMNGFGAPPPSAPPPESAGPNETEINITLEGLDETLTSTNWQLRKGSYLFLHNRLTSLLLDNPPNNLLSGSGVYASLDESIPIALKDKNAGALDAAIPLAVLYCDSCQDGCTEDAASQIMASLLKGPAFASSRSSTLNSIEDLVLKLIEVSPEGSSSIDIILDLIHLHGLKSRKPKVVIFSAKLVLKATQAYGAGLFPIPKLSSHSESLIGHSNAQAREVGIQLLAEMCRTLGSKTPLEHVIDKCKTSQQSQLDSLLEAQPTPTEPSRRLRCKRGEAASTEFPEEALAALKMQKEAARPAVNLFQVDRFKCYKEQIKLDKWSEKVAALDALIDAGGKQPFKLCPPSSSANYTALLRELKPLLNHTHFAVVSKTLAAFGMLSEGVGEQLYSNVRPLLPELSALFKDKKLTNAVAGCLDKMFANVWSFDNLLDSNDSLPSLVDEKKQKNALVRKGILEHLTRCVEQSGTYGTRGGLTSQNAEGLSKLACDKLKDSDAGTRKAATNILQALLARKDESVVAATKNVTSALQTTNPRAYKSLQLASAGEGSKPQAPPRPQSAPVKGSAKASKQGPPSRAVTNGAPKPRSVKGSAGGHPRPPSAPPTNASEENADEKSLPPLDEAIQCLSVLAIPKWQDDIDDGGVLAGIQSSSWKARMGALVQLAEFYRNVDGEETFNSIPSLFVLVRECTKSFKESNFNVAKALLELFTAISNIHAHLIKPPESYLYVPVTRFATEKIGDRKLSAAASECLYSSCTVKDPQRVLAAAVKTIGGIKSPLVHEALLDWFNKFLIDFGAAALSTGIQVSLTWVLKECESNNVKVKKSALVVIGTLHEQLGPVLEAFVKSKGIESSSIDKAFSDNPHDTNAGNAKRKMKCVTFVASGNSSHQGSSNSKLLSIPSTDLMASLKSDCLTRINTTEGKNAWKIRKEAMEEVAASVKKSCSGLIATEGKAFASLKQLFAALRSRLSDSQSNLKPIAAALIGSLLSHLDDDAQAKLGKLVFAPLANAAMNDMKKTMRDASLSSLSMGTERSKQNGGGTNMVSIECFIACLEGELSDAALKSAGLADVLAVVTLRLESIAQTEALSVKGPLAKVIVLCLLSSKAGTRSAAEKLLDIGVVPSDALDKEVGKLKPAQQRSIRSFIPKSEEKQAVVNTRRPPSRARSADRPSVSSSGQTVRRDRSTSKKVVPSSPRKTPASETTRESPRHQNPLHLTQDKSSKLQRLSMLGRSDHWPEYPEEPSGDPTYQSLRKSWSQLIPPSSAQLLFPQGGIRSHEDAIEGCELISHSIDVSRNESDVSFLEQLDLIFKWAACSLFARDHTSGLRALLSTIQLLFERLNELSYVMNDAEAIILLPFLFEKAGVAKSQFKDQFGDILSSVRVKDLYQLKRFGPNILMRVVEKSKSTRPRLLAAAECNSCVNDIGAGAIGKKGLIVLSQALDLEKVTEIRMCYLDLFASSCKYVDLDKLLSIVGDRISDRTKQMIVDRCSKRVAALADDEVHVEGPKQTRSSLKPPTTTRTPSRKSIARPNSISPRAGHEARKLSFSSSSAAAAASKTRPQHIKTENQRIRGLPPPSPSRKSAKAPLPPAPPSPRVDSYANTLRDIRGMVSGAQISQRGSRAIHVLLLAIKNDTRDASINPDQIASMRQRIASDLDQCLETLTSVLAFAFEHGGKNAALPYSLIRETVDALTYIFRSSEYVSIVSEKPLEYTLRVTVHALLDDRLAAIGGVKNDNIGTITRAINKLALRAAIAPSRETSLSTLILLQQSTISSSDIQQPAMASKVYTKLFNKIMKEEYEKNPGNPLREVELDALLYSFDWLLQTMEEVGSSKQGSDELLMHSKAMTKGLMLELVKCRGNSVREALTQLELPEAGVMENLVAECEQEINIPSNPSQSVTTGAEESGAIQKSNRAVIKETRLAELVHNFAEAAEGPGRQVALVVLSDFLSQNLDVDLEAHLSHTSPQFKEFILDQIGKASKENSAVEAANSGIGNGVNESMKNLQLKAKPPVDEEQAASAASLRARLEALKR